MPRETQAQKIARMEEENSRLREELDAARGALEARAAADAEAAAAPPAEVAASPAKRGRGTGRAVASVVLIVIAAILAPIALVANTADRLLTDTDYFVDTLEPIIEDPAVQQLIIDEVTDVIRTQAKLDDVVSNLFDGLDGLDLPPAAIRALQLLEQPAINGLDTLIDRLVTQVVTSDAFRDVITQSLRITHAQVIAALSGHGDVLQISATGEIGIALGPIVEQVKTSLADAGFPFADLIPAVDSVIVVAESSQAAQLVWLYQLAVAVGPWLQWVVIALFVVAVLVARRWAVAIFGAGLALAISASVLAAGIGVGRVFALTATAGTIPGNALGAIYDTVVASIVASAVAAIIVGLALAVVAALAGPWGWAVALRGLADTGADTLRTRGEEHGLSTGRFGELVYRGRIVIRVVVAFVAAAIILFVRPLTPAIIIWTLVLSLLVVAIARILERPVAAPEEAEPLPVG
ncbi:hypothetical protein [Protaetiibacter mangrovi]|uniref:Integral membrane protein n=1 Tax=Protaetiibacter mangrovi TaxID=2970926 RepID=A0ABT1ZDG2_9MICO|nr:hypothetical protein [Protaetiibacter mangrovi]MCS0498728.1 hypothetical protein [Protaetiibacter mangrovi]